METGLKMTSNDSKDNSNTADCVKPELPAAAKRALAEAEERRKRTALPDGPKELGGRGGNDPARYGDWEVKGRAIDF